MRELSSTRRSVYLDIRSVLANGELVDPSGKALDARDREREFGMAKQSGRLDGLIELRKFCRTPRRRWSRT
jgi:hypothetical protein